ncbi:MAG: hypothetical protein IKH91_11380 [Prevotella sp.]|nr:hypothetical protein [Prevotella sp.]
MSKIATFIKPLLPLLSAVYGLAVIYLTALPLADGSGSLREKFIKNLFQNLSKLINGKLMGN